MTRHNCIAGLIVAAALASACKDDPPPPSMGDKICAKTLEVYTKVESTLSLALWAGDSSADTFCTKAQVAVKAAGMLVGGPSAKYLQPGLDKLTEVAAKCTPATAHETQKMLKTQLANVRAGLEKTCAK